LPDFFFDDTLKVKAVIHDFLNLNYPLTHEIIVASFLGAIHLFGFVHDHGSSS
jgi:hypothetical protein